MIAKNNPDLLQASNDLYTVNADEIIRQQARARADAEFWERNKNAKIKQLEDTIIEQDNTIAENQNCWLKRMQNYFVFRKNSQN